MLKTSFRRVDIVARYGGEEFTVLMPETGSEDAFQAAERIRKQMEEYPFVFGDRTIHITASFGITFVASSEVKIDDLVYSADMALYAAKQGGRNKCIISSPERDQKK